MKKVISAIIAAVMIVCSLAACGGSADKDKDTGVKDLDKIKAAGVIRVGMECNYAPFNWTQAAASDTTAEITSGGYADGYDIQIAKKLADSLGVKLEVVKTDLQTMNADMQVSQEEYAEISTIKPLFLNADYK